MAQLMVQEDLDRLTAAGVIAELEWAALVFQAAVLVAAAAVDPFPVAARWVVLGLVLVHVALLQVYRRWGGPFARGGAWLFVPLGQSVAVTALLAVMATPGTFGWSISTPGCGYSNGFWVLLSGYPWVSGRLARWRVTIELAGVLGFAMFILMLMWLVNDSFEPIFLRAAAVNLAWILTGYTMGKSGFALTRRVARTQAETQRRSYSEFFDFLHSHVKASLAAIRLEIGAGSPDVLARVEDLGTTVSEYRVQLLLAQDRVSLATLISESVRLVNGPLDISAAPRVGSLSVDRARGVLIGRVVGDLLKNSLEHGATQAAITCGLTGNTLGLSVQDNGPGFSDSVFNDPAHSLWRLQQAARSMNGNLELTNPDDPSGACVQLSLPLRSAS